MIRSSAFVCVAEWGTGYSEKVPAMHHIQLSIYMFVEIAMEVCKVIVIMDNIIYFERIISQSMGR